MISSAERPRWIPIQDMVPPDSIGAELISKIPDLGVRRRPETILEQPLKPSLFVRKDPGLSTYADILRLPIERLPGFNPRLKLPDKLDDYLKGLLILPHSKLLAAIYGLPQFPAPLEREQEIVEGVESVLDQMPDKRMLTIGILRFGLHDGITRTLEETGKLLNGSVTQERVRQIEAKGLRKLRHSASGVERYLVLPQVSFGREVFGAILRADLPELDGRKHIQALYLSRGTTKELSRLLPYGLYRSYGLYRYLFIQDLVITDLSQDEYAHITGPVKDEIALALRRRANEVADKLKRAAEQKIQAEAKARVEKEKERRSQVEEPKGNFISEFKLSPWQLERVDDMPLTNLGLTARPRNILMRAGIKTVGALLRMNRQELRSIRHVGVKTEADIIEKLAAFLKVQANLKSQ